MTPTEELRALLDGRGVKWWPMSINGYYEERDTEFVVDGKKHTAHEWGHGLAVYDLTPAQAVEATLGRGECELVASGTPCEGNDDVACTRCGAHNIYQVGYYDHEGHWRETFAHCPNCGKAVKR